MHPHELAIDDALVARLLASQMPELAELPMTPVRSTGTVNAVYRLGDQLCARIPRVPEWAESLDREWRWLPVLAPHLTLEVPAPVARGHPSEDYPCAWSVYRWIDGHPYTDDAVADEARAAEDLARFVLELRSIPVPAEATATGRRPLRELDLQTRDAISSFSSLSSLHGTIDVAAALSAWDRAVEAPAWDGRAPVWLHADLLRPNVLVHHGRVHAVIDFGGIGVGDPAADVIAAWSVLGPVGRPLFRTALGVDDATWERARGFALHQAALIVPYYLASNPGFVETARRTVEQVVLDVGAG
jgi:aminoglycoside phosphotransferase (APT) family kinase protein